MFIFTADRITDGQYTLTAVATNLAGATSPVSSTLDFTLDTGDRCLGRSVSGPEPRQCGRGNGDLVHDNGADHGHRKRNGPVHQYFDRPIAKRHAHGRRPYSGTIDLAGGSYPDGTYNVWLDVTDTANTTTDMEVGSFTLKRRQ